MTEGNSSNEKPSESNLEKAIPPDALKYCEIFDEEEDVRESLAIWPVCPKCGHRREVTCPICHVTGDLFPLADIDYWDPQENPGSGSSSSGCNCGGSCGHEHDGAHDKTSDCQCMNSSKTNASEGTNVKEDSSAENIPVQEKSCILPNKYTFSTQQEDDPMGIRSFSISSEYSKEDFDDGNEEKVITRQTEVKLVVCHVCSEPFVPKFLSKCSQCGYDFDKPENSTETSNEYSEEFGEDNYDLSGTITVDLDNYIRSGALKENREQHINHKLLAVLLILLGLGCAAMVYFYCLFK